MEWTNKMVLEFLSLFELEPVIWNPKHEENRKKDSVTDAWRRIQSGLSFECKIEDLKRKKDSLMAYYRIHTRKIKKVKRSDTTENEYRTSWFAFEAMNSFLGDVYDCAGIVSSEETDGGSHTLAMEFSDCASDDSLSQPKTGDWRERVELTGPKQESTRASKTMSECEMYGQLLASKLAKLDEDDRLTLMNNIDNIVFQATMRANRKRKHASPASADVISSPHDPDDTQPSSSRRLRIDPGALPHRKAHPAQSPDEPRTDYVLATTAVRQYKPPTVYLLPKINLQPRIINIKKEMEKDDQVIEDTYDPIKTDED